MFSLPLSDAIEMLISSWLNAYKPYCLIGKVSETRGASLGTKLVWAYMWGWFCVNSSLFINLKEILEVILWSG